MKPGCKHYVVRYVRRPKTNENDYTEHWVCNDGACRQEFMAKPDVSEDVAAFAETEEQAGRLGAIKELVRQIAELLP